MRCARRSLLGALLLLTGCRELTETSAAFPEPLLHGATLQLTPEGLRQLTELALSERAGLGELPVTLPAGHVALPAGGTVTFGASGWTGKLSLAALTTEEETLALHLTGSLPDVALDLLVRPPLGVLTRCRLDLTWEPVLAELDLQAGSDATGSPRLASPSHQSYVPLPHATLSPDCRQALDTGQDLLRELVRQAVWDALEEGIARLPEELSAAFGLTTSLLGQLGSPAPAEGSLLLGVRASTGGVSPGDGGSFAVGASGVRLPLQVGFAAREAGRCAPPGITEPAAPSWPPVFPLPEVGPQVSPAGVQLAISAQGLARLTATALEAGFFCQPLRGEALSGMTAGDLADLLPLTGLAAPSSPLLALLRPGEPSTIALLETPAGVRVTLRRLALDLYLPVDGAQLRLLTATADVVLDLEPVAWRGKRGAGIALRLTGTEVTPRMVGSELLAELPGSTLADRLPDLYTLVLDQLLATQLVLPAPLFGSQVVQLVRTRVAGEYLILYFAP